ncbi:MAG: hypothetical protein ACLRK9_01775 [Roseburia hominis]
MDDRYVAKRVIYLLGMSAATILFTTAAAFIRGQYLDEWIVLCYHQSGISGVVVLFIGALPDEAEHCGKS